MKSTAALLSLLLSLVVVGCAAPADDSEGEGTSEGALQADPRYDAVIRGGTKVETDTRHTAEQSASTHLIGFIRGAKSDRVLTRLLSVNGWSEIRDASGTKPFKSVELLSDATAGGVRTLAVKFTLDKGVTLEVEATAKAGPRGTEIRMTNTTGYKHWLAGTILEKGKLHIAFDLVPYQDGVIVEATMSAKLKKMEDEAAGMTGAVKLVFDWIAAGSR